MRSLLNGYSFFMRYHSAFTLLLIIITSPVTAAPTGSDLLYACNESVKSGFDSIEGQMCTWYATPCDCNPDDKMPKVCLPEDLSKLDAARIIIGGLTEETELQMQTASDAAIIILARKYPCQ
jgi:hypothetical protein